MLMIIGLTGLFLLLILIDLPLLLQKDKQKKKILIIYLLLLLNAYIIGLLLITDKAAPLSPSIIIEKIIKLFLG